MHNLEIVDGVASMAYAGETPWHTLGNRVPGDLTPAQMAAAARADYLVEKRAAFITLNGKQVDSGAGALVRIADGKVLKEDTILTFLPNREKWHEIQNEQVFAFFNEFVMAGDMEMHTAGVLGNGDIIWCLAKVNDGFTVVGRKDEVESYLLFVASHRFGTAHSVFFTPVRVVCQNTVSQALSEAKMRGKYNISHRNPFDPEHVKEQLGIAHRYMVSYKEKAKFLASKKYTPEEMISFFKTVFPIGQQKKRPDGTEPKRKPKEFHRGATYSMSWVDNQPGAEFAPGTWWNLFNAATFYTNHYAGKSPSARVESLWMGEGAKQNQLALNLAVKGAEGKLDQAIKELMAA